MIDAATGQLMMQSGVGRVPTTAVTDDETGHTVSRCCIGCRAWCQRNGRCAFREITGYRW